MENGTPTLNQPRQNALLPFDEGIGEESDGFSSSFHQPMLLFNEGTGAEVATNCHATLLLSTPTSAALASSKGKAVRWTDDSDGEGESGRSSRSTRSSNTKSPGEEGGSSIYTLAAQFHTKGEQTISTATARRMAERPRECAVCTRPASCCHFNVPSCLGCRSFFRRSVLSQRHYTCKAGGNCTIGQASLCRACRFDRCILVGMNIGVIRATPDDFDMRGMGERLEGRRRELANRKKKQPNELDVCLEQIEPATSFLGQAEMHLLNSLLHLDEKLLRIRHSETGLSHKFYQDKGILDILHGGPTILAMAEQFSASRVQPRSMDFFASELARGHHWVMEPNWLHIDSFLCLQFIATVPAIQQLCTQDKIALISSNALATVTFSQAYYSQQTMHNDELILFPTGFSPICFKRTPLLMKLFCDFMKPFQKAGFTQPEFVLLRMLILLQNGSAELSPEGFRLVQADLEKYSGALMLYERCRLGEMDWPRRYAELLFFVAAAIRIGQEHRHFLTYFIAVAHSNREVREKHPNFVNPEFVDCIVLGIGGRRGK